MIDSDELYEKQSDTQFVATFHNTENRTQKYSRSQKMNSILEAQIRQLSEILTNDDFNYEGFETLLMEVTKSADPETVMPLLALLDDSSEHDDVMFGLVHSVESFPYEIYFENIIKSLPFVARDARRWCCILHIRIMNSEKLFPVFIGLFKKATQDQRDAELFVLNEISTKQGFSARCEWAIREINLADLSRPQ